MADIDSLKWSVQNGDIDKVKQESFDIHGKDIYGKSLLHCAADYGQLDVLDYLLSLGANVNLKDKHGMTPLLNAVFEGHTECVKLLLANGADKTIKAPSGDSVADVAEKEDIKNLFK